MEKISNLNTVYISSYLDVLFEEAGKLVIENNSAKIGSIQRAFKIGFNRASKILEQLTEAGVVNNNLEILLNLQQFDYLIENDLIQSRVISDQNESTSVVSDALQKRIELYNNKFDYMEGHDFEYFCAELLRKNHFEDVIVTPASGDYGVDILAYQNKIKFAIQCKCYSSDLGVDPIYQISGGAKYYEANIGIVLTNRYFTGPAKELAQKIGIVLWDRDFLLKLIEQSQ